MVRHIPLATAAEPGLPILLPIHSLRLVISSSESQPITRPRPRRGATAAALASASASARSRGARSRGEPDATACSSTPLTSTRGLRPAARKTLRRAADADARMTSFRPFIMGVIPAHQAAGAPAATVMKTNPFAANLLPTPPDSASARPLIGARCGKRNPTPDVEINRHLQENGIERSDHVVTNLGRQMLVEDSLITESLQVELQALRLNPPVTRPVVDADRRPVRLPGDGAAAGELTAVDGDFLRAVGDGKCLEVTVGSDIRPAKLGQRHAVIISGGRIPPARRPSTPKRRLCGSPADPRCAA